MYITEVMADVICQVEDGKTTFTFYLCEVLADVIAISPMVYH